MTPPAFEHAFITGASSGLGRAMAIELARRGTKVHVAARRRDELEALVAEVRSQGGHAEAHVIDVGEAQAVGPRLMEIDTATGGLDLVIANAGVSRECWSGKLNWERATNQIDVNVRGAVATLVAVLPRMVERRRGHIVGISSLAQYRGLPKNAVYSATKAFLSTFLEGVRVDLRGTGVAVSDVRPGFVRTPMVERNKHPMPWMLEADDAARRVVDGISARRSVIAFPWQLASVVRTAAILPDALYDRAMTKAR